MLFRSASQKAFLTPDYIEPNPKNPIIAAFFRNIGYADQLGSGVRNLFKYSRFYSGGEPEFIEGDVFRIIVPLDENLTNDDIIQSPTQSPTQSKASTTEKAILQLIGNHPELSQKELAEQLELNLNTLKYHIRKMQKDGRIERQGTKKKGKWIIR